MPSPRHPGSGQPRLRQPRLHQPPPGLVTPPPTRHLGPRRPTPSSSRLAVPRQPRATPILTDDPKPPRPIPHHPHPPHPTNPATPNHHTPSRLPSSRLIGPRHSRPARQHQWTTLTNASRPNPDYPSLWQHPPNHPNPTIRSWPHRSRTDYLCHPCPLPATTWRRAISPQYPPWRQGSPCLRSSCHPEAALDRRVRQAIPTQAQATYLPSPSRRQTKPAPTFSSPAASRRLGPTLVRPTTSRPGPPSA